MKLEFHHIKFVAEDVDRMHDFYTRLLGFDDIPQEECPRTQATEPGGYDGKIRFATDRTMQMHRAERQFYVAFKNGQVINPVERGLIAFRTDDLAAVLDELDREESRIPTTAPHSPRSGTRCFSWTRRAN